MLPGEYVIVIVSNIYLFCSVLINKPETGIIWDVILFIEVSSTKPSFNCSVALTKNAFY
jgi:hypothetical protein